MKTGLIFMLVALLAFAAACSKGNDNNNASSSPASPSADSSQPASSAAPSDSGPDLSKKFTISKIAGIWADTIPGPDGAGVKAINERYNVDLKSEYVPYDVYESKLPVVMAGGGMPDVIGIETVDANFVKWAKQGAFLPLNDYIDKFETFKMVPKSVLDAVTVDGKIYAIPEYFPRKYGKKPIIRKDWLDNLGLPMPTNYDELIKVAIAFAKDDPDQNGKDDTYGLGLVNSSSGSIVYGIPMGAAWDGGWYHKNEAGQYIPGLISPGFKKQIEVLRDLYAAGALNKDWPVSKIVDVRNDFFAGKYGIFFEQPYDFNIKRFQNLKAAHPEAEIAVIPPFEQEDGMSGYLGGSGYYEMFTLNANLKNDPEKVERILYIIDEFRKFIPVDERTPDNAYFDWKNGGLNVGYEMINGVAVDINDTQELQPEAYITQRGWAPNDEANEPEKLIQDPFAASFAHNAVETLRNTKVYVDPINRVQSDKYYAKYSELSKQINVHHVKMVVGQESVDDYWDIAVKEFLDAGGQEIIDEVNALMQAAGITGEWE